MITSLTDLRMSSSRDSNPCNREQNLKRATNENGLETNVVVLPPHNCVDLPCRRNNSFPLEMPAKWPRGRTPESANGWKACSSISMETEEPARTLDSFTL